MEISTLSQVLRDDRFPFSLLKDFISLMQKFEVVLLLDETKLLIPSLLPAEENRACVVLPMSESLHDSTVVSEMQKMGITTLSSSNLSILTRYYLLPFIPNGFFSRLLARVMGSKITEYFSCRVAMVVNTIDRFHWRCWRSGIILVHHNTEIVHISPNNMPPLRAECGVLHSATGKGVIKDGDTCSIQVIVAVLPREMVCGRYIPGQHHSRQPNTQLAIWMLRQLTEIIESVFDDWYEAFARHKGFDINTVQQANPCPHCQRSLMSPHRKRNIGSLSLSVNSFKFEPSTTLNLFSSPYCVLAASRDQSLTCPQHGNVSVANIAPDLVR